MANYQIQSLKQKSKEPVNQKTRVCQVKCVSFLIFYQRPYQTADSYEIPSNIIDAFARSGTVVKRTVE